MIDICVLKAVMLPRREGLVELLNFLSERVYSLSLVKWIRAIEMQSGLVGRDSFYNNVVSALEAEEERSCPQYPMHAVEFEEQNSMDYLDYLEI